MSLPVRPLTPDDAERYVRLRRAMVRDVPEAFFGAPGDDQCADAEWLAERLADPEQRIFAAEAGGELVSVAGVFRSPRLKCRHRATVWGVYTAPDFRRRGLSRATVARAIDEARSWNGVSLVAIAVSAHTPNPRALYESLGFEPWGREPAAMRIDGRDLDEIHMVLRL